MTKRVVSKKKIIRLIIIAVVLVALVAGAVFLAKAFSKKPKKAAEPVKVVDKIDSYGYELDDNETSYYKQLFEELKKVLNESSGAEEEYAKLVVRLFASDFFNLDNKVTKNDIGGTQYVYQAYREDFEKLAKEGIYRYIESNIYNDRKQELPVVKEVTIDSVEQKSFEYLNEEDKKAYFIKATIAYEKELGYQKSAEFVVIHSNNRLEIAKMS